MGHTSRDDHELSDILDRSLSEQQKQATNLFTGIGDDLNAFRQKNATPEEVLEKSLTERQKRTGQIFTAVFDDFKAFQKKGESAQAHLVNISLLEQEVKTAEFFAETDESKVLEKKGEKTPEPLVDISPQVSSVSVKADKAQQKKEEKIPEILLDKSRTEQQKQKEPIFSVSDEDIKALLKKEGKLLDKSLTEEREKSEVLITLPEKQKETREHLYVLGNVLLGVLSLGIVHAIFYIGCLIAYGNQLQKWESKDPITWFFHRVNAKIVIKEEASPLLEGVDEEEESIVGVSA